MSYTFTTLRNAVEQYTQNDEATFVSNIDLFVRMAEERILKSVQLPDQRKNVQGNLTTSNRFLATPSDYLASFSLAVISSNEYTYLDFKHNSFIKEYVSNSTTTGKPKT